MARRYWVKVAGRKFYFPTLAHMTEAAQNAANNLRQEIQTGWDKPRARRKATYARNPAGFHNLEASGTRRGEYVGYAEGRVFRIRKRPGGGWVAAEFIGGRDAGKGYLYGRTLGEISAKLSGAGGFARNPAAPGRKKPRQSVGAYDEKLAYFGGAVAARDGAPRSQNPHYGKEATAWRAGYDYVANAYRRNPVNPHLKRAGVELASFLRGRDLTAAAAPRKRKPKAARPAAALPKAAKGAKRSPSKDGAAARRAGLDRSQNPYETGTMGHRLWANGFDR